MQLLLEEKLRNGEYTLCYILENYKYARDKKCIRQFLSVVLEMESLPEDMLGYEYLDSICTVLHGLYDEENEQHMRVIRDLCNQEFFLFFFYDTIPKERLARLMYKIRDFGLSLEGQILIYTKDHTDQCLQVGDFDIDLLLDMCLVGNIKLKDLAEKDAGFAEYMQSHYQEGV